MEEKPALVSNLFYKNKNRKVNTLDLISGLDEYSRQRLESAGIVTLNDLINCPLETVISVSNIDKSIAERWKIAASTIKTIIENIDTIQSRKIVLVGLDNAGKTSMLLRLKKEPWHNTLPTQGMQREVLQILGFTVSIWDFGGQTRFRESYFEEAEINFSHTDLLFFAVDVQDEKRISEAKDYLFQIVSSLEEHCEKFPNIVILIHKADPKYKETSNYTHNFELIQQEFTQIYPKNAIKFISTSIFDKSALLKGFVTGFHLISDKQSVLDKVLKDFISSIDAKASIIFTTNHGIPISAFSKDTENEKLLFSLSENLIASIEDIINQKYSNLLKNDIILHIKSRDEYIVFHALSNAIMAILLPTESYAAYQLSIFPFELEINAWLETFLY